MFSVISFVGLFVVTGFILYKSGASEAPLWSTQSIISLLRIMGHSSADLRLQVHFALYLISEV